MKVIDKIKDYYLVVIDLIAAHPHWALWLAVAAISGALAI